MMSGIGFMGEGFSGVVTAESVVEGDVVGGLPDVSGFVWALGAGLDKAFSFLSLFNFLCLLLGLFGPFRLECLTTESISGRVDSNIRFLFPVMFPFTIRAMHDPFVSFRIDMVDSPSVLKPVFANEVSSLESMFLVSRTLKNC